MSQKRKLDLSTDADRVTALEWMDESDEGENVVETDSKGSELEDNVETQHVKPEIFEVYYFYICFIGNLHNIPFFQTEAEENGEIDDSDPVYEALSFKTR